MSSTAPPLLRVAGLRVEFRTSTGPVVAVDDVSFDLPSGQILGLVGESGSGKTATALSIMRLIDAPGRIVKGSIELEGVDLLSLPEPRLRELRGRRLAMVFQEPMTALNPVLTVGRQVAEGLQWHGCSSPHEAREKSIALLRQVGIPAPEQRVDDYPHRLSGGMRQRVLIAMALACDPEVLIADEPTSALDVTIQAQILALLAREQTERSLAVLLITHDLGVVWETCDRVAVMYAGRLVEQAETRELFRHPRHPYTAGLLQCLPSFGLPERKRQLPSLRSPGPLPPPSTGCRFRDRCPTAQEDCEASTPALLSAGDGHAVACFHPL
jgi:peptide/nickel transport system ATP-binding protein